MATYPDENSWWNVFRADVVALYEEAPDSRSFPDDFDFDLFKWWSRVGFSLGTGVAGTDAKTKHLRELEQALGIPEQPIDGGPAVSGYPDENSWWNDLKDAVVARYMVAGRIFPATYDFDVFKWWSRTGFTCGTGVSPESAKFRHLRELRESLGYPPPRIVNHNRFDGDITVTGRVIRVDGQPRLPLFCHAMELFSACTHNRWDDVRSQLEEIAKYYTGIRFCDVLGYWDKNRPGTAAWSAWEGKEVTPIGFRSYGERAIPATPDYYGQLERFLTMCHDVGLRVMHDRGDMNAWSRDQKLEHMRNLGRLYTRVDRRVLGGLWACNEAWQNGGDDITVLVDMIQAFKQGSNGWLPAVVGLSAPGGELPAWFLSNASQDERERNWGSELPQSFIAFGRNPATVMTCHGLRDSNNIANMLEHYFGYGYDPDIRKANKPLWNTEPVGGGDGVSVGQVNDVELLCGIAGIALLTGQPWTHMSGNGVFWKGRIEQHPGFYQVARLTTWIPQDVATYQTVIHAGAGRSFSAQSILIANDPTRFDQAIHDDGRFVAMWHTAEGGAKALRVQRACREFKVIDMITGAVEHDGAVTAGQQLKHNGKARLVIGRLA